MIAKKNIFNVFVIFIFSHLIIWTLVPTISNVNLPLDTIEALAWGSNLDWGYDKHPPLSAYAVEFIYLIFGPQDWAYYLLSQVFVVIAFIYLWKFSNEFFKNKIYSLLSILILESIIFFNYTTPEFNVYVCQLPFRVLTVYYCWKSINENKSLNWILFGLFASAGFLTHYSFIFLLLAIVMYFIFLLVNKEKFKLIFLLPFLTFIIITSPHLLWLFDNNFTTISYALNRTGIQDKNFIDHVLNPFWLLFKQVGILIPFFIMFSLIFVKNKKKINKKFKDKKFLFLFFINILPILFIFIISFLTGAKIRTMWMSTFYLFLGIFFIYLFEQQINLKKIKNFIFLFLFLFFISPLTYLYVSLTNDSKRTDYPGKEIARLVQNKWDQNFINDVKIIVGDEWSGGNLSYHLKTRPVWVNSLKKKASRVKETQGVIYIGNPKILKKICPGAFGVIKPVGYCMIGKR
jgi:4-amino-4-deoxy-L-arabinose transferase-like glycosyltransferase